MRRAYVEFTERHDAAWELVMAGLAVMYVALRFAIDGAGAEIRPALEIGELVLTAVFAFEFFSRLVAVEDRVGYLRGHWIDLVALIPAFRGARVFRLLRLLRLVRTFSGVYRAVLHVDGIARHRGLAVTFVAWLGVMVLTAAGLYVAEHGVNEAVNSPFDALWWGVTTMTTVGYGDVYPITPEGRIAAMALMILGIGLFSVVTATITSYLMTQRDESKADDMSVGLERVSRLFHAGDLGPEEFALAKARLLGK